MSLTKPLIQSESANEIYNELIELVNSEVIINNSIDSSKTILNRVRGFRPVLEKLFYLLSSNMKDNLT